MANNNNTHVISYLTLRKLLGGLGISLPIILVVGAAVAPDVEAFQSSISQYYHTPLRDVFVCILTSFGLFLFTYKGYESKDDWASNLAGICALAVAFFPTSIGECEEFACRIHFISASLFFLLLSYIAYFLFTKSDKDEADRTKEKRMRNRIYRICAFTMVGCLILLALYFFLFETQWPKTTAFWLETIALWAFGVSWLVKGKTILKDD
jgi:uncharacterized membrane protein